MVETVLVDIGGGIDIFIQVFQIPGQYQYCYLPGDKIIKPHKGVVC